MVVMIFFIIILMVCLAISESERQELVKTNGEHLLNPQPLEAKIYIVSSGYVRVVRIEKEGCKGAYEYEVICKYIEDDTKRQHYAEDICEVLYMLNVPCQFIRQ